MTYCSNCKGKLKITDKFCPACGTDSAKNVRNIDNESKTYGAQIDEGRVAVIKIISFLLVFGVLFAGGYYVVNSFGKSLVTAFDPNATPTIPEVSGPIGSEVKDGQLTFLLKESPSCKNYSESKICKFHLKVSNHSSTAIEFFASNQKLADSMNRIYDSIKSADMNGDDFAFEMQNLNPNFYTEGYIYFEVTKNATLSKLIVHDSIFSSGASINLN